MIYNCFGHDEFTPLSFSESVDSVTLIIPNRARSAQMSPCTNPNNLPELIEMTQIQMNQTDSNESNRFKQLVFRNQLSSSVSAKFMKRC